MATILLRRGVYETLASNQAAVGVSANDVRVPAEMMGARLAWTTIVSGAPTSLTVALQGTLDGTNWSQLDSSTNVSGEVRVLACEGVLGIRADITTLSGGTSPNVSIEVRVQ